MFQTAGGHAVGAELDLTGGAGNQAFTSLLAAPRTRSAAGSGTNYVYGIYSAINHDQNAQTYSANVTGVASSGSTSGAGAVATLLGVSTSVNNLGTATVTTAAALSANVTQSNAAGTISTGIGLAVNSAVKGAAGTFTTNYGIRVRAQTAAASNYGIAVAAASTQTLWVDAEADNITAASGIAFGVSRDTTLYRSGVATLKTDGSLQAGLVRVGAVGPSGQSGLLVEDATIYRVSTGVLATQNHFSFRSMNSSSTTFPVAGSTALSIRNLDTTVNNWAALEFHAGTINTAGIGSRNVDPTNGYGELWFYGRSAGGIRPRLRLPSTGGVEVYGDASSVVYSVASTGFGPVYPTLGADVLTNGAFTADLSGWTAGANWVWNSGGAQHTPGSTATLTQALSGMTSDGVYYVTVTVTGRTAGSVAVSLGATTFSFGNSTSGALKNATTATPTLTLTPTSDFDGTIDSISLQFTNSGTGALRFHAAAGVLTGELKVDGTNGNVSLGVTPLQRAQAQVNNTTAIGNNALRDLAGGVNQSIGNTAIGSSTLRTLVIGSHNTALGYQALLSATQTGSNTAIGSSALQNLTLGINNTALGFAAGRDVVAGNSNVFLGIYAGVGNTGGSSTNAVTAGLNNVFIGVNSCYSGTTQWSSVVAIGNTARVDGNGTVAIGVNANAGAAGAVAIGADHSNAGASTTTANEFKFGTANHTYNFPGASMRIGTNPATTGAVRLPNGTAGAVAFRTADNTADVRSLYLTGTDDLMVSSGSGKYLYMAHGGVAIAQFSSAGLTFNPGYDITTYGNGMRIGSASNQKFGYWGATPVVRDTGWSVTAGYTSSKSFDPETASLLQSNRVLGALIDVLKTYGILGA
jgi:hypothetical protein